MQQRQAKIDFILNNLHIIKSALFSKLHEAHKTNDITMTQSFVLRMVGENPNITTSKIAKCLGISISAVTQVIDTLIDKRLIEKCHNSNDKRVHDLKLSDSSHQKLNEFRKHNINQISQIFDKLSDQDLLNLETIIKKISENIE